MKVLYVLPVLCQHCDDAPCMAACQAKAIYKREDGLVIIDPAKCTGLKSYVDACPYGAIYFNETLSWPRSAPAAPICSIAVLARTTCVDACPTRAIKFMEEAEAKNLIGKADPQPPNSRS